MQAFNTMIAVVKVASSQWLAERVDLSRASGR